MSDNRPRPRYGEYAPGYVPPTEDADASPAAPGRSAPPASAPGQAAPATPPVSPPGPWVATPASAPPVRSRTGDTIATVVLLVLGLIGMLVGVVFGIALSDRDVLNAAFERQGFGSFNGTPGSAPLVIIVSHVVLYLLAVVFAIRNLVRGRLAFWIPLAAGVVAAVFFWVSYISVIASDPTFFQRLGG